MNETPDTAQRPAQTDVATGPLVRRCTCKYQQENPWGYTLFKWHGKRWKKVGHATHVEDVAKYVAHKRLRTTLIQCDGCGDQIHRDPIPPNSKR